MFIILKINNLLIEVFLWKSDFHNSNTGKHVGIIRIQGFQEMAKSFAQNLRYFRANFFL